MCAGRPLKGTIYGAQQADGIGDVLDHMTADHNVGRYVGALFVVVLTGKAEAAVGAYIWPDIARIEPPAEVVHPIHVDKTAKKSAFTAANLDDSAVAHALLVQQLTHQLLGVLGEQRREGLTIIVAAAVVDASKVEDGVEYETAGLTAVQAEVSALQRACRSGWSTNRF